MLGIPPLQKRSLLLFFQQYGQVLSDVFLNTRRLFGCSGRNERMPNCITQREPQRRGAVVQSLFMSLAWTSSCVGHFPSICFYAGIPIWENCFFFFSEEIWWSQTHPAAFSRSGAAVPSPCHSIILHSIPLWPHLPGACAGLYLLGTSFLLSPRIKIWRTIQKKIKISLFMLCFTEN